jgi:hypothetical protein
MAWVADLMDALGQDRPKRHGRLNLISKAAVSDGPPPGLLLSTDA